MFLLLRIRVWTPQFSIKREKLGLLILIPRENVAWVELEHSEQIDSVDKHRPRPRPPSLRSALVGATAIIVDSRLFVRWCCCRFDSVKTVSNLPIGVLHFPTGPSVTVRQQVCCYVFRHASLSLDPRSLAKLS